MESQTRDSYGPLPYVCDRVNERIPFFTCEVREASQVANNIWLCRRQKTFDSLDMELEAMRNYLRRPK